MSKLALRRQSASGEKVASGGLHFEINCVLITSKMVLMVLHLYDLYF
jgi:hypothetical protein